MYKNVHSNFIHSQQPKIGQNPNIQKENTTICDIFVKWNFTTNNQNEKNANIQNNLDESQKHCAKTQKPDTKEYILYNSLSMKL